MPAVSPVDFRGACRDDELGVTGKAAPGTTRPTAAAAARNQQPGADDRQLIYQFIAPRGRECGVGMFPHRFRHHFTHTWLDKGGAKSVGPVSGLQRAGERHLAGVVEDTGPLVVGLVAVRSEVGDRVLVETRPMSRASVPR